MDLTAVFLVERAIEEIGGRVGDRIVVGESEPWPVCLVRNLGVADARWAFTDRCRLEFTLPPPSASSLAAFEAYWRRAMRPGHLWLMR